MYPPPTKQQFHIMSHDFQSCDILKLIMLYKDEQKPYYQLDNSSNQELQRFCHKWYLNGVTQSSNPKILLCARSATYVTVKSILRSWGSVTLNDVWSA